MAHCIQGKPHIWFKTAPCGCKFWAVRKPKYFNWRTYGHVVSATVAVRSWNRGRLLGAVQCEHHTRELERFK